MGGIHGYENQCSLSLGGFIQFGSNQIQPKATFGISVSALNRITVTGIFVYRKRWYLANVKLDMFISILYVNIANLKSVPIEIFAEILNVFMIVRNIRQNSDVFYIDLALLFSVGLFGFGTAQSRA